MKQATLLQKPSKGPGISSLALGCLVAATLSACSSTKGPAPIESRTPSSTSIPRAEPARRVEVPAAGVTPPVVANGLPASPKPSPVPSGAETGTVKQGSTESRPLGPSTGSAPTPAAGTSPSVSSPAPAVVLVPPLLKSGPKGSKRPYSESVFAEVKGADVALVNAPGVAVRAATPPVSPTPSPSTSPAASPAPTPAPSPVAAAKPGSAPSFAWPIKGRVLANFSEPKQMGMILDGKLGEPISAAGDGKVIFSGPGPRGYGNLIIVKHEGELLSVYAHNKTLLVKDQESVKKGQKIAELGESGTDSPKLHFEIRRQGKPVDPKQYLPAR
jgi:lipoprotein NlpD